MCGFAGQLNAWNGAGEQQLRTTVTAMNDAIRHRGPNDNGEWIDASQGYAVGHRRLSVIDLSAAGHQPMVSASGRFKIAYNGEIYNHEQLRASIVSAGAAPDWRGHSDTEVLLAGIELWGLRSTLEQAVGMFALALWDCETAELSLARDRVGEKPLYWGWQGSGQERSFLFGSELKALKQHPAFEGEINRGALILLLRHNYIPAPHSIYSGISKVEPGTILTVSRGATEHRVERYWSMVDVARAGQLNGFVGSPNEAVVQLEVLATEAVRQQMASDVPLGAFLSGGIDSSAVVALMQNISPKPVKTFTIGFGEKEFNEAVHAKAVAKHLGTDHHELYVDPTIAQGVIPDLPSMYCEPFSDSSQIPTFLVSRLAREHVTVSLSGDAGDELFGGYNRYAMTANLWSRIRLVPRPVRRLVASALLSASPSAWDRVGALIARDRFRMFGDKAHKGAGVLDSESIVELYRRLNSHDSDPAGWVKHGSEPPTRLTGNRPMLDGLDEISEMMVLDGLSYLPDDILVKVDRAAMAVSLETRVPFLDHRLIEYAWSLPLDYKIRGGVTKWPLRQLLYRHVPRALIDRPKMGFGVPIADWLRGPLRDWAETLIAPERLAVEGYWDVARVRGAWEDHLSGRRNFVGKLWSVLMFQAWLEAQ
jgi:asparagine synthase (glutamine-hydrolysing)